MVVRTVRVEPLRLGADASAPDRAPARDSPSSSELGPKSSDPDASPSEPEPPPAARADASSSRLSSEDPPKKKLLFAFFGLSISTSLRRTSVSVTMASSAMFFTVSASDAIAMDRSWSSSFTNSLASYEGALGSATRGVETPEASAGRRREAALARRAGAGREASREGSSRAEAEASAARGPRASAGSFAAAPR